MVESKEETVTDVFETVQDRNKKGRFYSNLIKVRKLLDSLIVDEYENTEKEKLIAKEIALVSDAHGKVKLSDVYSKEIIINNVYIFEINTMDSELVLKLQS